MLRTLSAVALALAICACEPSLPYVAPTPTVTAVFDPTTAQIPLPNDLVFFNPVNSVCPVPANAATAPTDPPMCAQAELLAAFARAFPSDQELAITIDFTESTYVNGRVKQVAPKLDLATITPVTLFVVGGVGGATGPMQLDPVMPDDYVYLDDHGMPLDHGTLTLHYQGRQPWPAGQYTLVMRGGDMGVKTLDTPAIPVTPSPVFDLVEQGKDMTLPENLGLLKNQNNGSTMDALAQGEQLNLLIALYQTTVFPTADNVFPHEEMAIASRFQIGPTVTNVTVDPARGLAPLPIDLLRDPTTHKFTPAAACALAGATPNKDGSCPSPAAAGFLTLDGFSTTGAILAPTSDLINGATVASDTLKLYDLSDPEHPQQVPAGSLIIEPCEFTAQFNGTTCDTSKSKLAPVIAFQPAGATSSDQTSVFRTKPLKDNTDYAVVMTTDIKDKAGNAIGPGTVAKILRFKNPLFVDGHSALQGIDDVTANALDTMRKQLIPVFTTLGTNAAKVAMAYTFHTQTVLKPAVQLAGLPYSKPNMTALPDKDSLVAETPAAAFAKYGVVPRTSPMDTTPGHVPLDNIDQIIEVDITTFNALDPATGAFLADPTKALGAPIHVLIATPKAAAVPACQGALAAFGRCAPMMVFRHGLARGRADMLLIADSFAAGGMVTVAIDAAKHGDRSLCRSALPSPASGCAGVCTALPMAAGQGDTAATGGPPGICDSAGLLKGPVAPNATGNTDGIARASGNYLISANFFRTRDTLRQDVIDQSQLVRAIAFVPSGAPPTGHVVFDHMVQRGVIIDPATVYFSGQSLGAIQGTLDVATNPRITKAALNAGGGTLVDILSTSPAFATPLRQLLTGLGITPGTPQYLQFLTVAKTVLDPADPVNFAGHITASTLPDFIANSNLTVPQAAKKVLIQVANCDQVVPSPFGLVWSSNLAFANLTSPLGPLPNDPTFFAMDAGGNFTTKGTFQLFVGKDFNRMDPTTCTNTTAAGLLSNDITGGGGHGFLLTFEHPDLTAAAQGSIASFMTSTQLNPVVPSVVRAQ